MLAYSPALLFSQTPSLSEVRMYLYPSPYLSSCSTHNYLRYLTPNIFSLRDTAGQERYRTLTRNHFRNAQVWSLTDITTDSCDTWTYDFKIYCLVILICKIFHECWFLIHNKARHYHLLGTIRWVRRTEHGGFVIGVVSFCLAVPSFLSLSPRLYSLFM